jgi:phosphoribosylformylglycinamidine synthase subunit PurS
MRFKAEIKIMTQKEILDPQGKVITQSLQKMGMKNIENVRIGKHIDMILDAESEGDAEYIVETACKKLLANLVMETYSFEVKPLEEAGKV